MAIQWFDDGTFNKRMKVSKLRELLALLPPDYDATCDNVADTQDINIYTPAGEHYATVNMGMDESVTFWVEPEDMPVL